jgi:hypothetical protein
MVIVFIHVVNVLSIDFADYSQTLFAFLYEFLGNYSTITQQI